jgi:hypothetical protein
MLTVDQVREIRRAVANGWSLAVVGRAHGMTRQAVFAIVNRTSYGWVDPDPDLPGPPPPGRSRVFTDTEIREIRARARRGESQTSIARAVGCAQGTVSRIVSGKVYGHVTGLLSE